MDMATNMLNQLPAFWTLLNYVAVLIGFYMIVNGLFEVAMTAKGGGAAWGRSRNSYAGGFAGILFGGLLMSISAYTDALSQSLFNQPSGVGIVTAASTGTASLGAQYASAIALMFMVVRLVGLWAVIKGVMLFHRGAEDHQKTGLAWTHTIGGIIAINMTTFLGLLSGWIGGDAQTTLNQILGLI